MFWTFEESFDEDILSFFCFGNCFGYFIQKLGEFSTNLLVALFLSQAGLILTRLT